MIFIIDKILSLIWTMILWKASHPIWRIAFHFRLEYLFYCTFLSIFSVSVSFVAVNQFSSMPYTKQELYTESIAKPEKVFVKLSFSECKKKSQPGKRHKKLQLSHLMKNAKGKALTDCISMLRQCIFKGFDLG